MQTGCGTWPAFWTLSEDGPWPQGGEIDIIQGVSVNTNNLTSLHTTENCAMLDMRVQTVTSIKAAGLHSPSLIHMDPVSTKSKEGTSPCPRTTLTVFRCGSGPETAALYRRKSARYQILFQSARRAGEIRTRHFLSIDTDTTPTSPAVILLSLILHFAATGQAPLSLHRVAVNVL